MTGARYALCVCDAYGNLIDDGPSTYVYDAENRLISTTAGNVTSSYTYSGDGDRISQTVDGTLTTYVLDVATPLTMVLSETSNGSTLSYWHGLDVLAQSDGTHTSYFEYDGLGSVRQLTDSSGIVGLAQTFDPYGNGYSKAGSATTSLGFTGEQTDSNGFVFLRARYYNPSMGRFFQMDPSRLEMNPYQYALSNPVLYTDPTGLLSVPGTRGTYLSAISQNGVLALVMGFQCATDSVITSTAGFLQSANLQTPDGCINGFCRLTSVDWLPYVFLAPAAGIDLEAYAQNQQAFFIALDMVLLASSTPSDPQAMIVRVSGGRSELGLNMPLSSTCPSGGQEFANYDYDTGVITLDGAGAQNCSLSDFGVSGLIHEMGHGLDQWLTQWIRSAYRSRTGQDPFPPVDGFATPYSDVGWVNATNDWERLAPGSRLFKPKPTGLFVSPYAKTSPGEDLAETFAAAVIGQSSSYTPKVGSQYTLIPSKTDLVLSLFRLQFRGR